MASNAAKFGYCIFRVLAEKMDENAMQRVFDVDAFQERVRASIAEIANEMFSAVGDTGTGQKLVVSTECLDRAQSSLLSEFERQVREQCDVKRSVPVSPEGLFVGDHLRMSMDVAQAAYALGDELFGEEPRVALPYENITAFLSEGHLVFDAEGLRLTTKGLRQMAFFERQMQDDLAAGAEFNGPAFAGT